MSKLLMVAIGTLLGGAFAFLASPEIEFFLSLLSNDSSPQPYCREACRFASKFGYTYEKQGMSVGLILGFLATEGVFGRRLTIGKFMILIACFGICFAVLARRMGRVSTIWY